MRLVLWENPARMRIPLCLFLFVAVLTLVTASQQTTYCILGCKCQEDASSTTKNLKILDCDSPLELSETTFSGISKKISNILFKNVVIRRIEDDTFNGFVDLVTVKIEDATIGAIGPSAFKLPELDTINFVRTTFREIPALNSDITELIFNDCKLTEVPKIDGMPELRFLNLQNNKIKNIDENTFSKCIHLEEVNLSNNSISKLPENLFVKNLDLDTLTVDYNPLESFQLNLSSDLELLSLKFCKLSTFDRNSAKNLNALSSLYLSGNQISILPIDAFDVMEDLDFIDLSNNKLVELDDDIFFNNSNLLKIVFDNNNFKALPNFQTKTKLFKTNHFSCKNCGLTSIGNAFENMKELVRVDLSNNKITSIDGVFTEMRELKEMNLSHNSISTISGTAFGNNNNLEILNLSHNPLKPLDPVVFASILSLKQLDVSNCSLSKLWTNHNADLPSLKELLLGNNNLSVISSEDLQLAPKLILFDLQENPLRCTPELHDLIEYLLNKPIYPIEKKYLFKTHESLTDTTENNIKELLPWKQLSLACAFDDENELINDSEITINEEDDGFDDNEDLDDDEADDEDEDDEEDDEDEDDLAQPSILDDNFNLAKAPLLLSVFMLSALVVLTVAVTITLLILKRNKSFDMHNGNLPRFKIPLWNTQPGQKKHSGSVYKPLSEDLSGPRTPVINRYEFKQTPQVHNSIP